MVHNLIFECDDKLHLFTLAFQSGYDEWQGTITISNQANKNEKPITIDVTHQLLRTIKHWAESSLNYVEKA